jgi:hypothetical protein
LAVFLVRRVLVVLIVGGCALLFSQAPEFAQQYRYRLASAIDELTTAIQIFDEQANHAGLDRQTALNIYASSNESSLHQQVDAMRRSVARYQLLSDQLEDLAAASSVLRPVVIARQPDHRILSDAWRGFMPSLPVSLAGVIWCGAGVLIGMFCAASVSALFGTAARFRREARSKAFSRIRGKALQ